MSERISESLQQKISDRLSFYQDMGISLFYRDRLGAHQEYAESSVPPAIAQEEAILPKPARKSETLKSEIAEPIAERPTQPTSVGVVLI